MKTLYASNTNTKYPLESTYSVPISEDIIIDMSLSIPTGIDPLLTNLVVSKHHIFCSFETAEGEPIAHIMVPTPTVSVIYQLTMNVDGYGWIVFGPGIGKEQQHKKITVALDPTVILHTKSKKEIGFQVNGITYPMPTSLNIKATNYMTIQETDSIELIRDDSKLTATNRRTLFKPNNQVKEGQIFTINGVAPTHTGNIDIMFQLNNYDETVDVSLMPILEHSTEKTIGLLLTTDGLDSCRPDELDKIIKCRTEMGAQHPLPLDAINCEEDCDEYFIHTG